MLDFYGINALAEPEDLVLRSQAVALIFEAMGFGQEWQGAGETVRRRTAHRIAFQRYLFLEGKINEGWIAALEGRPV